MNILIIGSGRMGIRHANGAANIKSIKKIFLTDISKAALDSARAQLIESPNYSKFYFSIITELETKNLDFELVIISSTAANRLEPVNLAIKVNVKYLLLEKPIGQSIDEVNTLINYIEKKGIKAYVNLNMRLYDCFIQLKNDLENKPQLKGEKVITVNTGTVGIGANGIHYIDLLFFLLDAENAILVAGEIEDTIIPSGRGPQFGDFGGWATLKFFGKDKQYKGRAHLSFSSKSSVFGDWSIVAPHGKIHLNELDGEKSESLRKEESALPIQRYGADYLPLIRTKVFSPFLGDLTQKWIEGLISGQQLLPSLHESLKTHQLLFEWLSLGKTNNGTFPIT